MKKIHLIVLLLSFNPIFSQVGIGTTTPNAQLDIRSSNASTPANNDGVLIPKIDEFPSTNPTVAQDGMMIFATGNGSVTKGFYYWNNTTTSWTPIISGNTPDHDWYEQNTTSAPNDINDNIFHLGNVGIGQNLANSPLDVFSSNITTPTARFSQSSVLGTGIRTGIENSLTTNTDYIHYGILNSITHATTSFPIYGFYNRINGNGPKYGFYNNFETLNGGNQIGYMNFGNNSNTSSTHFTYGYQNNLIDNSQGNLIGLLNTLSKNSTNGQIIGVNNYFGGDRPQTGVYNFFNVNSGSTNIGFRSNFIGNGNAPIYGVYNTINNTGSGPKYINFGEVFNTATADIYGDYLNIISNASGLRYGSYKLITGNNGGNIYGNYNRLVNDGAGSKIGTYNQITGNGYSLFTGTYNAINAGTQSINVNGTRNIISGYGDNIGVENSLANNSTNAHSQVAVLNTIYGTNNGINISVWNQLNSTGNGSHTGVSNNISGSGTGIKQGVRNNFSSTAAGEKYGLFNNFTSTTNTQNTGIRNEFISNNNSVQYGVYNQFNSSLGSVFGEYNLFDGPGNSDRFGNQQYFYGSGNGNWYGFATNFDYITTSATTGNKYGFYASIPPAVGGASHYGVYSYAGNLTNGYAGYFSGRVSIGNTTNNTDHYILPLTRGTAGQVMQTDGAGNVNWVNPSNLDDGDWSINGTSVYKSTGNVSIGTNINPYPLYIYDNNGNAIYASNIIRNFSGASETRTLNLYTQNNSTSSFSSYGIYNSINKPTTTLNSGDVFASVNLGTNNYNGTSLSRSYGSYNSSYKYNGTNGISYGSYNYAYNQSGSGSYGIYSSFGGGTISYAGYFAGNVYTTGTYLPSASILKYNVKDANSTLSKLVLLKVKEYQYKTDELPFMNLPKGNQTGFIAEEIETVFPELVTKAIQPEADEELVKKELEVPHEKIEFKAVNYTGLVPHLVKAIQEQQTEIEKLKQENKELKEKIDYILTKIE
ncbi:MAG: tail fiber domain-containing protein [Flavobacteriaceae bacterium]|nr:tail fiber domain-containing protein [Flavobacteriaceae bacterium]